MTERIFGDFKKYLKLREKLHLNGQQVIIEAKVLTLTARKVK